MSELDLDAIEKRAEAAKVDADILRVTAETYRSPFSDRLLRVADRAVAASQDIPAMLQRIREQDAEIVRMRRIEVAATNQCLVRALIENGHVFSGYQKIAATAFLDALKDTSNAV